MRELVIKISMSADGFMCGPNNEMDWLFRSMSPEGKKWVYSTLNEAGLHIMGHATFNDMKKYWPFSDDVLAGPMNDIPKIVFTHNGLQNNDETTMAIKDATAADMAEGRVLAKESSKLDSWVNAAVAQGDMAESLRTLKSEKGKYILAQGGASFIQSVVETGLVDEYRLVIHPVLLGQGKPVFSKLPEVTDLKLISTTVFPSNVIAVVYRPVQ